MAYVLPDPLPWTMLAGPLAAAEDALARLDELLDACASLWLQGELVHVEDLVLHGAAMDQRAPTHELTRAHVVLRTRRRIAAAEPCWALSRSGLAALSQGREEEEDGTATVDEPAQPPKPEGERGGEGGFN